MYIILAKAVFGLYTRRITSQQGFTRLEDYYLYTLQEDTFYNPWSNWVRNQPLIVQITKTHLIMNVYVWLWCVYVSKQSKPMMACWSLTPLCSCLDDNWSFTLFLRLLKRFLLQNKTGNTLSKSNVEEKSREQICITTRNRGLPFSLTKQTF